MSRGDTEVPLEHDISSRRNHESEQAHDRSAHVISSTKDPSIPNRGAETLVDAQAGACKEDSDLTETEDLGSSEKEKPFYDFRLPPPKAKLNGDVEADPYGSFECNVCFDLASEPVVTFCGHLYCWPCLYRWTKQGCKQCPVCKGDIDNDQIIPLYGRGASDSESKTKVFPNIPSRPRSRRAARPIQVSHSNRNGEVTGDALNILSEAFLGRNTGRTSGSVGWLYQEQLTPEQQHQVFLSRLLLMLGSFVIMCLLLF
ncbi:hypothetical protein CYMTET_38732 [Cymbomonas tetramitiformis]|uniref:RING-type E3 ubiquitin transferase n=1 Tax=Cymbomonas tetramitiformis TaxID=36881 RepID=A0AAE0CDN9_9CHLO|nr:hypothetical protein CYMTET_38732 [Cymbomonas tetramitiformis]